MLKPYVNTMIRINEMQHKAISSRHERNDEGFASAEVIALAVAGVLIAGAAFVFFKNQIGDGSSGFLKKISDTFNSIG